MAGLTLSRRDGESILIGDDIVVTVKSNSRGVVRLNIVAPPNISVDRAEFRAEKLRLEKDDHSDGAPVG